MDSYLRWILLLIVLGTVSSLVNASSNNADFSSCESAVKKWASSTREDVVQDKHTLKDLLFFLHVPRTGGRTYFHCLLKKLYPNKLECPRSYDKLRFNPRKENCRLLATHDDYSVMSKLPKDKTSVVTVMRNPVDRVFSAYEFSIEVAARFLVHPNLSSVSEFSGRIRKKGIGISTLDIWPWKYLVPWMRKDLFDRRDARKGLVLNYKNDSYNMGDIAMPLDQYINDPIALDIIHNGATFQVAGLTNNSYLAESHKVRHCVQAYPGLGNYVLEVAKKRLDNMLYVGLTEDHKGSATKFANVVGTQVISQLVVRNSTKEQSTNVKSEHSSSFTDFELENEHHQDADNDQKPSERATLEVPESTKKDKMTVEELMEAYEACTSSLRNVQVRRRERCLMKLSPLKFSKEARLRVPVAVINQINSLNSLDVELFQYARGIYSRQQQYTNKQLDMQGNIFINSYDYPSWIHLSAVTILILLVAFLVFVNARRRISKLKI